MNKKLDELGFAIKASQDAFELNNKITSDNAAKVVGDIAQQIQDEKAKTKSNEEQILLMAKKMSRMGGVNYEQETKDKEANYKDEFAKYLKKGIAPSNEMQEYIVNESITKNFVGLSKEDRMLQTKSLVSGINPEGGYFVRPDFSNQVVTRVFETSPLRQYCNVITTNSDVVEMLIDDNQATLGGWVGETSDRNDTNTPEIGQLRIAIHELFAQPLATQKMLDDAGFNVESWLNNKVADKFSRDENTTFVLGDGSQKPRGFTTYRDYTQLEKDDAYGAYGRKAIERVKSGVNGDITGDSLKKLQNSLKEEYQPKAVWGTKRKEFEKIITLKDAQGRYIFDTRFLQESRTLSLLGKDVVFMNDMPGSATDSLSMVYADFSRGYTIVDRLGIRILRDPYTAKPYIKYYATKRVGGDVSNFEAIKLLQLSV
tara:strand:+ start:2084 stop:3367 length:1284 start_codon:yes stop_codon:yes gene_type:complete